MRQMKRLTVWAGVAVVAAVVLAGLTGCEEGDGSGLTVSPESVTLTVGSNFVWFTATQNEDREFGYPITWSVSDTTLGSVIRTEGARALYQRSGNNGDQIVTAKDSYGEEGYATVKQTVEQYTLTLTAYPSVIQAGSNTSTIVASGGEAPYDWWVRDSNIGSVISGRSSDTAVYQSRRTGANVVHAKDANGVMGTVTVTQQ